MISFSKDNEVYPNKQYEKIIVGINEMILNGTIKKGVRLPSERDLADQFQISRVPVREALKILEFLGILKSYQGDGMYLTDVEIPSLINKIFFAIDINEERVRELFEVRLLLECYAAKRAAILRNEEDIQKMEESIEEMKDAIASSQLPVESSLSFHLAVIESAKNSVLSDVYKTLTGLLEQSRERTLVRTETQSDSLAYHRQIHRMIQEQDIEGAERYMREHLQDELKRI